MTAGSADRSAFHLQRGVSVVNGGDEGGFRVSLGEVLRAPQFWAAVAVVAMISVAQDTMEALEFRPASGISRELPHEFVRDFLFIIPVAYSALRFGMVGALAMALLCTLMTIPNWVLLHSVDSVVGVTSQMLVIYVIAILVGSRVERETGARKTAESALDAANISAAKYRSLFESAGEGILVVNQTGQIVDANQAAEEVIHGSQSALIGQNVDHALPQQLAHVLMNLLDDCNQERTDVLITGPDGEDVWLAPACTRLAGSDRLTQVVLSDVTERRHRQSALEAYAGLILHAQEDERQRIAQDLHDETVQSLVILCRRLDIAEEALTESPLEVAAELATLRDEAEATIESLRGLLRGLRPATLDDLGLISAIRVLVSEVATRAPLAIDLVVDGEPRRLNRTVELALFRVAQEALRNVERHSGAARATVTLGFHQQVVDLSVEDDGAGFRVPDPLSHLSAQGQLGILGMRERARLVGGSLQISSTADGGTSVTVIVPAAQPTRPPDSTAAQSS